MADLTPPLVSANEQFLQWSMDARIRPKNLLDAQSVALYDLWLTYWSYAGNAGILEFEAFIYGVLKPTEMDLYLLECAVRDTRRS